MIQELQAIYDTIYKTGANNNNVAIVIQPGSLTPNTVEPDLQFVSPGKKIINNTTALEGELCMVLKNGLKDIDWEIDDDGNLIINAPDADNYSLDVDGNLIYTYR